MAQSLKNIFINSKITLSLALIIVLMVQSIGQSFVVKCPGMEMSVLGMATTKTVAGMNNDDMHHGEMDHASMDHASLGHANMDHADMSHDDEMSHSHYCPPTGCDICTADDCSQCYPFQLNAVHGKALLWQAKQTQIDQTQAKYLENLAAFPPKQHAPTRAPPLNI